MKLLTQVVVAALWTGAAQAQVLNYTPFGTQPGITLPSTGPVDLSRAVIDVREYETNVIGTANRFGLVSVADLIAAGGGVTPGQLSAALAGIAARLDRFSGRFREGVALAGSINVLPPNSGDRFAVSFGGAGYDGAGAGSISVSARLREDVIAYGAVARGPSQTLVKGGLGISFR